VAGDEASDTLARFQTQVFLAPQSYGAIFLKEFPIMNGIFGKLTSKTP
jgi:hypothetical protein